jgi:hypothetical protein
LYLNKERIFRQGTDSPDGIAKEALETVEGVARRGVRQFCTLGLKPNFGEKPLDRANPDLGAVVALCQLALAFGTRNYAKTSCPSFQRA